jgi:hypothetical protein
LLTQIVGPQQNAPLQNSKEATTGPAAGILKLLKLLHPRAAVMKICEVKRGNVTPARLLFWGRHRYMID